MSDGPNPRTHPAEAEAMLVGAMLLVPDCIMDAAEVVEPGDFHLARCRMIFEAILSVNDRGVPVDFVTLSQELTERGHLAAVGGSEYLVEVAATVTSASHARHHAALVAQCAQLRKANQICLDLAREAREDVRPGQAGDVSSFLEEAERRLFEVGARDLSTSEAHTVGDVMAELFAHLENPQELGLECGIPKLDNVLLGFRPGEFVIIAARPGKGKTTLALNFALNMARDGHPGLFVSLEMSTLQLMQRVMSRESDVSGFNLRRGRLDLDDMGKIRDAAKRVSQWPLSVCDAPEMTPARLRAMARRQRSRGGIKWLMVDYLQLMSYPGQSNRVAEVSCISRGLKQLGMEMGIPVIALSQLSRAAEDGPRPRLHHLRESGTLEQDADVVCLMWQPEGESLQLDISKNRHGATGDMELAWRKEVFSIEALATGTTTWSI